MSNTFSLEDGSVYEEMWKTLIETDRQTGHRRQYNAAQKSCDVRVRYRSQEHRHTIIQYLLLHN